MTHRCRYPERDALVCRLVAEGLTYAQVSARVGLSASRVCNIAADHGLKRPHKRPPEVPYLASKPRSRADKPQYLVWWFDPYKDRTWRPTPPMRTQAAAELLVDEFHEQGFLADWEWRK